MNLAEFYDENNNFNYEFDGKAYEEEKDLLYAMMEGDDWRKPENFDLFLAPTLDTIIVFLSFLPIFPSPTKTKRTPMIISTTPMIDNAIQVRR